GGAIGGGVVHRNGFAGRRRKVHLDRDAAGGFRDRVRRRMKLDCWGTVIVVDGEGGGRRCVECRICRVAQGGREGFSILVERVIDDGNQNRLLDVTRIELQGSAGGRVIVSRRCGTVTGGVMDGN